MPAISRGPCALRGCVHVNMLLWLADASIEMQKRDAKKGNKFGK